jgi:hypothetical protein
MKELFCQPYPVSAATVSILNIDGKDSSEKGV